MKHETLVLLGIGAVALIFLGRSGAMSATAQYNPATGNWMPGAGGFPAYAGGTGAGGMYGLGSPANMLASNYNGSAVSGSGAGGIQNAAFTGAGSPAYTGVGSPSAALGSA